MVINILALQPNIGADNFLFVEVEEGILVVVLNIGVGLSFFDVGTAEFVLEAVVELVVES